jgi:hypothetical protein
MVATIGSTEDDARWNLDDGRSEDAVASGAINS